MIRLIRREKYLNLLRCSKNTPFIKVITGVRRCGKSTLLGMFRDELISSGIDANDIYFRNFNNELDDTVFSYRDLITDVKSTFYPGNGKYIFLDEIQNVVEWERAVSSFYENGADIYITGSNSRMLSSDIATILSGRTIEIHVYPLSFEEFLQFREVYGKDAPVDIKFKEYIERGGMPATVLMADNDLELVRSATIGTYNTAFLKDVIQRNEIRNSSLISHIAIFLMKNLGNRTSITKMSRYLSSKGMKVDTKTLDSYLKHLEDAKIFSRADRYDSKTKDYLMTLNKFYICDLGIRNALLGYKENDLAGILENIVYNELLFRNGNASVVSVDGREIDFMTKTKGGSIEYYQVAVTIFDEATRKREIGSLKRIDDNYPKYIITMDRYPFGDIDGIIIINIIDFLSKC